jgi:hypothetical protein
MKEGEYGLVAFSLFEGGLHQLERKQTIVIPLCAFTPCPYLFFMSKSFCCELNQGWGSINKKEESMQALLF